MKKQKKQKRQYSIRLGIPRFLIPRRSYVATNKDLYHLYYVYDSKRGTLDAQLQCRSLNWWNQLNGPAMKKLSDELHALSRDFFEHNENGTIKIAPPSKLTIADKHGNRPNKPEPILLPGKNQKGYEFAYAEVMNRACRIFYSVL